jgi:hypothetical protein
MMQSPVESSNIPPPPMNQTPVKQGRSLGINAATKDRLRQAQIKKQLQAAKNGTKGTAKTESKDRKSRIGAALGHFLDDVSGSLSTKSFRGDKSVATGPVSESQSAPKASAPKRRTSKTAAMASPVTTASKRANYFEKFGKPLSSEKLKEGGSFRVKDGLSNSDHQNPVRKSKRADSISQSEHGGTSSTSKGKKASSKREVSKQESNNDNGNLGNMLSKLGGAPKKRGAKSVVSMPTATSSEVGQERRPSASGRGDEVRKRRGSIGPIDTGVVRKRSGSKGPIDTGAKRSGSIGPNADARRRRSAVSPSGASSVDGSIAESGSVGSKGSRGSKEGSNGSKEDSNGSKGSKAKNTEKKAKSKVATVEKVGKVKATKKLSKPNNDNGSELGNQLSMVGGAPKKKGAKSVVTMPAQSRQTNKSKGPALGKSMRASQKINKSKRLPSKLNDPDLDDDDNGDAAVPVPKSKKVTKAKSKKPRAAAATIQPDAPPADDDDDDDDDDWAPDSRPSQRSIDEKSEKSNSSQKDITNSSNQDDDGSDYDDDLSLSLDDIGEPDAFEAQEETIRAMAKKKVPKRLGPPARPPLPEMRLQRGQSMMLQRDTTRRAGKSNSLANLVEYTEEELPSTSYFASNHILINRERMKRGLRPLSRNSTMDELAREHANKMASSKGCSPIQTTFVGNVLRGESIRSIHRITMQHKDGRERYNILNPYFQDFGVGTSKGADGMLYMCQLFSERIELTCMDTEEL